jgi:chromosome segregation ATPase
MSELAAAVELVKQQAKAFQAVLAVADALSRLRDLEQTLVEREAQVATATIELDKAVEERVTLHMGISVLQAERDRLNALIANLNSELATERGKILGDAEARALEIVDAAVRRADEIDADVKQAQADHLFRLQGHAELEAAAQDRVDRLDAHVADIKARFG